LHAFEARVQFSSYEVNELSFSLYHCKRRLDRLYSLLLSRVLVSINRLGTMNDHLRRTRAGNSSGSGLQFGGSCGDTPRCRVTVSTSGRPVDVAIQGCRRQKCASCGGDGRRSLADGGEIERICRVQSLVHLRYIHLSRAIKQQFSTSLCSACYTYAENVALPAFTAACRAAAACCCGAGRAAIDRYLLRYRRAHSSKPSARCCSG